MVLTDLPLIHLAWFVWEWYTDEINHCYTICRNCPIRNLVHTEIGRDEYYALTDIEMGYVTERLENDQDFCKKIDGLKIIYKLNQ